jgi:xylose dehydrogenase (NAD/NADP)
MAETKRKIRWGVLGYAKIARENVIPALLRSANAECHVVASRDEAKLAECRARFPGVRTCRGYEEVLRDPAIDAVYLPLPNALHREWTIRAAEHGKHVLCEKPLALNAAEAREMAAACTAHGVVLMEAFMYRYTDRTRQVREVLRQGDLGELKFIQSNFCFMLANPASIKLKPELGGGALYDIGCYPINFTGWVLDEIAGTAGASRPESVAAACVRAGGIDESFSALLRYPSGLASTLHCSIRAHRSMGATLIGTEGTLEVPDTFLDAAGGLTLVRGDERREIPVAASDRYRQEVEDFSAALQEGRPPLLGLPESVRNLETIDRLFAAS